MNKEKHQWWLWLFPISGVIAIICMCVFTDRAVAESKRSDVSAILSETDLGRLAASLITVKHDNHLWIIRGTSSSTTPVVHHPDCPCQKKSP